MASFDVLFRAHSKQGFMSIAFCYAILDNSKTCMRMLIAAGADVNIENNGATPLMMKNPSDNAPLIKMLIKAGADVNRKDSHGATALMHHTYYGNINCINALMRAGADVNATNDQRETALMFLVKGYSEDKKPENRRRIAMRFLLREAETNVLDIHRMNPLTYLYRFYGSEIRNLLPMKMLFVMLYATGEKINTEAAAQQVPDDLQSQFNLMDICRRRIRDHLLELDPHTNLFSRVPRLGLPAPISLYLLYGIVLNGEHDDDDDDDDIDDDNDNDGHDDEAKNPNMSSCFNCWMTRHSRPQKENKNAFQ